MEIKPDNRLARSRNHQWRKTKDGRIIVFPRYKGERPDFHGFFEFHEFEASVWEALDGQASLREIAENIWHQLKHDKTVEPISLEGVLRELVAFADELIENRLVDVIDKFITEP